MVHPHSICPSNFYPRPPRGGRRACNVVQIQLDKISIHALREEGDRIILIQYWPVSNFYPRPPRGGRPDFSRAFALS